MPPIPHPAPHSWPDLDTIPPGLRPAPKREPFTPAELAQMDTEARHAAAAVGWVLLALGAAGVCLLALCVAAFLL